MSTQTTPQLSRRESTIDISGAAPKKFMNGWTKEQEVLMAEWSDVASCYRWLHDRCEKKYYQLNLSMTIPVIILSTLTGAANFAVGSFIPPDNQAMKTYVSAGLGGVSILAGILTTLGNFFQYAQKSESNRVASIAWGKFQRLVAVELAINPNDRIDAMDFLKICRQDLDRLIEQSPQIPDDIIMAFEKEFKETPKLKVPDICHGIEHTRIFDSNKTRLSQVVADAAVQLKFKKKMLEHSVMPNIDKKIQEELSSRIEQRIRELMPVAAAAAAPTVAAAATHDSDITEAVTSLGHGWRQLLTSRKQAAVPAAVEPKTEIVESSSASIASAPDMPLFSEPVADVRINVVGTDGSMAGSPVPGAVGAVQSPLPPSAPNSVVNFE